MRRHQVRVLLRGGLGNQLFGWAAGFSLAKDLGVELELDGGKIERKDHAVLDPRVFELGYFGLSQARQSTFRRLTGEKPGPIFRETGFAYDPRIEDLVAPVVLDGYFQSWRYFHRNESVVREFLTNGTSRTGPVSDFLDSAMSGRWVGVHVRRGDYLKVRTMAIQNSQYYQKAVELVADESRAEQVIVFTDDVGAARKLVPGANRYLGPTEMREAGDVLTALSNCDGLVAANSSLSWWASFLNTKANVPRVFPVRWFNDSAVDTRDLLPPGWSTILAES